MEMDINSLVKKVMDCGFRVHLALTPGYLEEVYKKAMMIELAQLVNYLTATGIDDGLLINFGTETYGPKRKYRINKSTE